MNLEPNSHIPRIRRTYNTWVANQTLEDFALRFTSYKVRKFSNWTVANTAIGAVSFLALEVIGAAITMHYGFYNAAIAIVVVSLILFILGFPIAYYSARYGLDIDLLTRGAGFGYIGSTITSLIYASFTFIFFAIEAAILAKAMEIIFGVPLSLGYFLSALLVIPLVTHGITFISRFQTWTQPIFLVLQIAPCIFIALHASESVRNWTNYTGLEGPIDHSFSWILFGASSAVLFALVAQIGEQVDYLRFLPHKTKKNRLKWWSAMIFAGPFWIVFGAIKAFIGSFLAYYAFQNGVDFNDTTDPTIMYLTVFKQMIAQPEFALGITGLFIVVCQFKINVTNTYAGSIAWSNFFSRLTHAHPGRVVWVVFNVVIGLVLMEVGIYKAIEEILGLYSILAVAWMAAIWADLVICKPLGLAPKIIEFKRSSLFDINPVGFVSMCLAVAAGLLAYAGLFGATLSGLFTYVTLVTAIVLVPLIAVATRSRFYIARESEMPEACTDGHVDGQCRAPSTCVICNYTFDHEDMAHCPAYGGNICSLCCSLDSRCGDMCKPQARIADQMKWAAEKILPETIREKFNPSLVRYIIVLSLVLGLTALLFWLVQYQSSQVYPASTDDITATLTKLFLIVGLISGVVVWLLVLAHDNRHLAEEETRRHTRALKEEIKAHEETDRQLQKAKEAAESANLAKSRYVVGLSHEFRTPLNTILGYAQLLEKEKQVQPNFSTAASTIRRSGEHLSGMIDGLLDIAKIEAGRLEVSRHKTALRPYIDQIVDMIALQAKNKNLAFSFHTDTGLPEFVFTDDKRLRQILLNLLSNAIKFTNEGHVRLTANYRNQIAVFTIEDTGPGIPAEHIERIFLPFERAPSSEGPNGASGTGLGLAITQLLVDILGGDLTVESTVGKGTTFTVKLMLSSTTGSAPSSQMPEIIGYTGRPKTIVLADDDAGQRSLIKDLLEPLGFRVIAVPDGGTCLAKLDGVVADILLLDISMPDMTGWDVAKHVRLNHSKTLPIIMISANAGEERNNPMYSDLHDGYIIKPFRIEELFDVLSAKADIEWTFRNAANAGVEKNPDHVNIHKNNNYPLDLDSTLPSRDHLTQMLTLGRLGFVRSIHSLLEEIQDNHPETLQFCQHMRDLMRGQQLDTFTQTIETLLTRHKAPNSQTEETEK